mmetsp:Transcript_129092/g.223116  ORF Transcript_129092/g.223116 Transcript_129092/m.223116 type:complete len:84 (-) Transcript_129092:1288-1539(-)
MAGQFTLWRVNCACHPIRAKENLNLSSSGPAIVAPLSSAEPLCTWQSNTSASNCRGTLSLCLPLRSLPQFLQAHPSLYFPAIL